MISAACALALCCVSGALAGGGAHAPSQNAPRKASLPQSDGIVDVLAADFYETSLRLAQSRQIEAETARRYLSLDDAGRAQFRAERRKLWRAMSAEQRSALRGVKRPVFANLADEQKQTFRRIASEALGAAPSAGRRLAQGDI